MPEVIHEHEETTGSSTLGVLVGVLIVILLLLAVWWFGFAPGRTVQPTAPGPAASAPALSAPAASGGGGSVAASPSK